MSDKLDPGQALTLVVLYSFYTELVQTGQAQIKTPTLKTMVYTCTPGDKEEAKRLTIEVGKEHGLVVDD